MGRYVLDRSSVKIGVESVPGVYELPTEVLPLDRGDALWVPELDKVEFDPLSGVHGSKEIVIIDDFATMKVSAKMKMPASYLLLATSLLACGMVPSDITGGKSFSYSTAAKGTVSLLQTGERVTTTAYGERADMTLSCEVGKAAELSLDFNGLFGVQTRLASADVDNTIDNSPNLDMVFMTKDCTAYLVNGNSAHFTKVEFKLGADIGVPKDTCPGPAWTKDIKPELLVTINDSIDNAQSFADIQNGAVFNFVIPLFGIDGVKYWEIVAPNCVVIEHKTPANDGLISLERTFECRKVNGDDNFELQCFLS